VQCEGISEGIVGLDAELYSAVVAI